LGQFAFGALGDVAERCASEEIVLPVPMICRLPRLAISEVG